MTHLITFFLGLLVGFIIAAFATYVVYEDDIRHVKYKYFPSEKEKKEDDDAI